MQGGQKFYVEFDDANTAIAAKLIWKDHSNHENVFMFSRLYHHHKYTPKFPYELEFCSQLVTYAIVQ